MDGWCGLNLKEEVEAGLLNASFNRPAEVQRRLIPHIIRGENVLGQSKSGTGKTVAYVASVLTGIDLEFEHCNEQLSLQPTGIKEECTVSVRQRLQCVVVIPTRETGVQVASTFTQIAWPMIDSGLRVLACVGGCPLSYDVIGMRIHRPQIIVGTPGRILTLTQDVTSYTNKKSRQSQGSVAQGSVAKIVRWNIPPLRTLVLDEADRLLQENFLPQLLAVLGNLKQFTPIQVVACSATFPPSVLNLVERIVYDLACPDLSKRVTKEKKGAARRSAQTESVVDSALADSTIDSPLAQPAMNPAMNPAGDTVVDSDSGLCIVVDEHETEAEKTLVARLPPARVLRKCFLASSFIDHSKSSTSARVPLRMDLDQRVIKTDIETPVLHQVPCTMITVDPNGSMFSFVINQLRIFPVCFNKICPTTADSTTYGAVAANEDECTEDVSNAMHAVNTMHSVDAAQAIDAMDVYYDAFNEDSAVHRIRELEDWMDDDQDWNHWPDLRVKFIGLIIVLWSCLDQQAIIFCNDTFSGKKISQTLSILGIPSAFISAKVEQAERDSYLRDFAAGRLTSLVGSDLLARGIDVTQVNLVISIDLPESKDTCLHRIGRAGRFGRPGKNVFILRQEDEAHTLRLFGFQSGLQVYEPTSV
ncbi:helicase [Gregarina niphandrodes]|uniref:RNA helicase n=1 Tax=Gregarina niphandrodes TaxID=110365 RepID=A0A023B1C9_GRENI|nr:helicase [Gregarina niphandrodes]EZG45734.1 helicase [Gregarina niphandrodes]|eukprot:XP_011132459.1 helicase [Gregarina niphandrodes]